MENMVIDDRLLFFGSIHCCSINYSLVLTWQIYERSPECILEVGKLRVDCYS